MTYVSNDPALWPVVGGTIFFSYFVVASLAVVIYDWVLTFVQEFELVWMQRWSLMTLLYVSVRYVGILYYIVYILSSLPMPMIDEVGVSDILGNLVFQDNDFNSCTVFWFVQTWTPVVVNAMLGVIMMTRIHAMYQRSQTMLILLAVVLLASTIATTIMTVIENLGVSGEEVILSGYRLCNAQIDTAGVNLTYESFIPTAVWEILAFCLAVWIAVKHFRELQQLPTGSTIGDCFTVLIKSHAFYFLAFAVVACFSLGSLSPNITYSDSTGSVVYGGLLQIVQAAQMVVLGPRLILSVRQYHAELVARSDEGTGITTIGFHAGGDTLTGGDV